MVKTNGSGKRTIKFGVMGKTIMKRNVNIDLLKIISCVSVIGLHSIPRTINNFNMALYLLCSFAVPVFYMTFGYQMSFRKNLSFKYCFGKILNLLGIIIIWNFVVSYIGVYLFPTGAPFSLGGYCRSIFQSIIQQGLMWQLWYLWSLIILYLLLPGISRINKRWLVCSCIILFLIGIILMTFSYYKGISIQGNIIQTFRIWTYMKYFLIGYLYVDFNRLYPQFAIDVARFKKYGGVLLIVFLYWTLWRGQKILTIGSSEIFYDDLIFTIWIVWIFNFIMRINLSKKYHELLRRLSH